MSLPHSLPCAPLQTKMLAVYGEKDPNLDDAQRLVNMFITGHKVGMEAWKGSSSSLLQPAAGAACCDELQRTVMISDVATDLILACPPFISELAAARHHHSHAVDGL